MWRLFVVSCLLSFPASAGLDCLTRKVKVIPRDLPAEVEMGVTNVHADAAKLITVFLPIPNKDVRGKLIDFHDPKVAEFKLPARFLVGDGSMERVVIGIDQRPGTRLALCLDELANELTNRRRATSEQSYEALRDRVLDYLDMIPEEEIFPWDEQLPNPGDLSGHYKAALKRKVTEPPLPTGKKVKVIPLEAYLQYGQSYCLQKNLLTALLLQNLKLKFKMVFGGGEMVGSGHNWIRLADGRHLDTTWQLLQKPTTDGALPGWFRHGTSFMFQNQRYLFVDLTAQ